MGHTAVSGQLLRPEPAQHSHFACAPEAVPPPASALLPAFGWQAGTCDDRGFMKATWGLCLPAASTTMHTS